MTRKVGRRGAKNDDVKDKDVDDGNSRSTGDDEDG